MSARNTTGMLIIPAISGTTEFVGAVELTHSAHVISELTEQLIDASDMGLELSGIEGNGLLYFHPSPDFEFPRLMEQVQRWLKAFHGHLNLMKRDVFCRCGACQGLQDLGLRITGHFGEFGLRAMGGRTLPLGKAVVLARQFAQLALAQHDVLLVSQELLAASGNYQEESWQTQPLVATLPVFGDQQLRLIDLEESRKKLLPAPSWDEDPLWESQVGVTVEVGASLERAVEALADISGWPNWVQGLSGQEINPNAPLSLGHHHVCIINGERIEPRVSALSATSSSFEMVMRVKPPLPILKRLYLKFEAKAKNEGTSIGHSLLYTRRPLVGRLFDWMMAQQLMDNAGQSLRNLKRLLETGPP